MLSKLVDVLIKFLTTHYSDRASYVRSLKELDAALRDCHSDYTAYAKRATAVDDSDSSSITDSDVTKLKDVHKKSVDRLLKALGELSQVFEIYDPELKDRLDTYGAMEAVVHEDPTKEYLEESISNSDASDFEKASSALHDYIKSQIKPEELH